MVRPARGAVSFWLLGQVDSEVIAELARRVERALGCPVVIQPGRIDGRPSQRPAWQGRSGTAILNQMERRQQAGSLTNLAIVADPVTSGSRDPGLFGYAYMGWGAACASLELVSQDRPAPAVLVDRLLSVSLHEIGHTLGLDDHKHTAGIACAMVGDVPSHRQFDPIAYPTSLCPACLEQARERMAAFGAEIDAHRFVPAAGFVFDGRYQLREPAGEGGYGSVWRAHDLRMNQPVALKFVRSGGFDGRAEVDLIFEAARARTLNHPNVVRVFDWARDAGCGALVMDWIDGSDLESLRQRKPSGVFDAEELSDWALQLCAAIQAVHDLEIVHQDIKPENCLIDRQNRLQLADFGRARTPGNPPATFLHGATLPTGTPGFAAPEQRLGAIPWRTQDIYSLGATLYWLLTGRHARTSGEHGFPAWDEKVVPVNAVRASFRGEPALPPIPATWETTIAACLEWNHVRRPSTAAEVARRLAGACAGSSGTAELLLPAAEIGSVISTAVAAIPATTAAPSAAGSPTSVATPPRARWWKRLVRRAWPEPR